jgi:hypothetical protein
MRVWMALTDYWHLPEVLTNNWQNILTDNWWKNDESAFDSTSDYYTLQYIATE